MVRPADLGGGIKGIFIPEAACSTIVLWLSLIVSASVPITPSVSAHVIGQTHSAGATTYAIHGANKPGQSESQSWSQRQAAAGTFGQSAGQLSVTSDITMRALLAGLRVVNYFPAHNGWSFMWQHWDPATIDADFDRLAALHANAVRVIIQAWTFGFPDPKAVMLSHLSQIISLADRHGLRVQLTLFDWWASYSDMAGSQRWARAIVAPDAGDKRVAFIELKNEITPTDPIQITWAEAMLPFLRHIDGGIPVTLSVVDQPGNFQALVHALASSPPDFYDDHYYGDAEASDAYATLRDAQRIAAPRPLFIGETGYSTTSDGGEAGQTGDTAQAREALQDHYYRTVCAATLALGLPVAAPWTLYDSAQGAIPPSQTAQSPREYGFGLYHVDGTPKPVVDSLSQFYATNTLNLSFNNGFEEGFPILGSSISSTETLPAQWSIFDASQGHFARDTTVAHSGVASARISASGGRNGAAPAFYITPITPIGDPGSPLTVSAWVLGHNATGSTRVAVAWFDRNHVFLGQNESPWLPAGTTWWTLLTTHAVVPVGAAYLQIHLKSAFNSGTVWFDDVTMTG